MKYLVCEQCGRKIKFRSKGGLSFRELYFCCRKCFDLYLKMKLFPISGFDFEINGEEDGEAEE